MTNAKITDPNSIDLKGRGGTLVFGHFNLIHPGHLRFLNHARSMGGPLVVAIQGDESLDSTQRDRFYSEDERAEGVAALDIVDLVVPVASHDLSRLLEKVQPRFLLLGDEQENTAHLDLSTAISKQRELGGDVYFHAGQPRYATSELLQNSPEDLEQTRLLQFRALCTRWDISASRISQILDDIGRASILVIGDTIVDNYIACDPLGLSAEAPVIVVKEIDSRQFVGGSAIVAAHIRALGANVEYVSVTGNDQPSHFVSEYLHSIGVQAHLISDASRPTTFKTRYMIDNQKLFRVSRLEEHDIDKSLEAEIIQIVESVAPKVDAVVISDFVYGVVTPTVLKVVGEVARRHNLISLADLQCSSQVGNVGKFRNMTVLCPTEKEARMALASRSEGIEWVAHRLMDSTHTDKLVLKLGQDGFISYESGPDGFVTREHFPALSTTPLDVTGAGDALLASIASSLAAGAALMESSAIGAIVASLAVRTVGNQPVNRFEIDKAIQKMGIEV